MAPQLLFDISQADYEKPVYDAAGIEQVNPHRGALRLIDAIVYVSSDRLKYVAYHDIQPDAFWAPGHIPGRPLFPGVLMIEVAAQVASFICLGKLTDQNFMGFVGVDEVKFRGQVVPGDRLVMLCHQTELRRRRCVCKTQGLINGTLVYEGTITGMPM